MKKLLLALLLLPALAFAQEPVFPIDSATQKITYTEVVSSPGTKAELFDKAVEWIALKFNSANDIIQVKDKDAGKIIAKWSILPLEVRSGRVGCNITLLFKDGKYKYTFTDIYYQGTSEFHPWPFEERPSIWSANMTRGSQNKIRGNTKYIIETAIYNLKEYMAKPSKANDF